MAEALQIMSTLGMQGVLQQVLPPGQWAATRFDPTAALLARIRGGEAADLAILTGEGIDELTETGVLAKGSRVDFARSYVGLAVRQGATRPDIGTAEACIAALRAAKSIVYSRAGASGIFFAALLERLGIATEINARATIIPAGFTAERVARGEAELAVQQVSELMAVPGVEILGKLPAALNTEVVFAGAVFRASQRAVAGAALLQQLANACTPELLREKGLEPA